MEVKRLDKGEVTELRGEPGEAMASAGCLEEALEEERAEGEVAEVGEGGAENEVEGLGGGFTGGSWSETSPSVFSGIPGLGLYSPTFATMCCQTYNRISGWLRVL